MQVHAQDDVISYLPQAADRFEDHGDGRIAVRLKRAWSDGTTHVVLTYAELVERLVALIRSYFLPSSQGRTKLAFTAYSRRGMRSAHGSSPASSLPSEIHPSAPTTAAAVRGCRGRD